MKKKFYFFLGIFLILLGAFLLLNSFSGITGFVVFEEVGGKASGVLGVVFVLGGIGILSSSVRAEKKSVLELTLIDAAESKGHENPDRDYKIVDSANDFGKRGRPFSLGELKTYLHSLHDPELVEYVQETYVPALWDKIRHGSPHDRKVARAFYEVFAGEKPPEEMRDVSLSSKEREDLKHAFRGYDGTITHEMKQVLEGHGLEIVRGKKHYRVVNEDGTDLAGFSTGFIPNSRTNLNFVSDLIHGIEEHRKKKLKKD